MTERKATHRWVAAALAATCVSLAACGEKVEKAEPTAKEKTSFGQPLECDRTLSVDDYLNYEIPDPADDFHVALLLPSLEGYYFQGVAYGAKKAAEEAGVELTVIGGQGYTNPSAQLTDAENVINKGIDALALFPVDYSGSVPVVDLATEKGIPVINVSTDVDSDEPYKILQDDFTQGAISAASMIEGTPEGGAGIIMGGPADASWSRRRVEGFKSVVAEHPEFTISEVANTNGYPDEGLASFENAVQAHSAPAWIYTVTVYALLPESIPADLKDVPYFTASYDPMVEEQLKSGGIDGTVTNVSVAMGRMGLGTAVGVLNGDDVPKGTTCLPSTALTAADVGSPITSMELHPEEGKQ